MNTLKRLGEIKGRPLRGAKHPGIGYIYVLVIMFIAITAGTVLSGGNIPVDPTSPDGPPTLPPYFNAADYDTQKIVLPSGALTPDPQGNLQLKTFKVNTCGTTTAVMFLVDVSASMEDYGKMDKTKAALSAFTKKFSKRTAVDFLTFSADTKERVPWGLYKDNKTEVDAAINDLKPEGWTSTRDGFKLALAKFQEAKDGNKFPGYHYNLILMTDGVPEIPPQRPRTCIAQFPDPYTAPAQRCFAKEEDPRVPSDLSAEIKRLGVQIYSVGIFSDLSSDILMEPYLKQLLQDIASPPLNTHYYSTMNANDINNILTNVFDQFCEGEVQ
jgi:hypothetical protein